MLDTRLPPLSIPKPGRVLGSIQARWRPAVLSEGLVAEVLSAYGLTASRPARNLPFGARNVHVRVATPEGRKVLKQYRGPWTSSNVAYEHSVLHWLEEVGIPAVRVNHTLTGDTLVRCNGRLYALFEYESGTSQSSRLMPYGLRLRLLGQAGSALGELHRSLSGFIPQAVHHLGFRSDTLEQTHDLEWYRQALIRLRSGADPVPPQQADDARQLRDRSDTAEERIAQLSAVLDQADLPRVVIHGDFGIHNLAFRRDGTVVVFDFELARLEWRLVDLVIVLSRALPESRRAFLHGYRQVNEITPAEWGHLPEVWEFYKLTGAVRSWCTFLEGGIGYRISQARRRLDEADVIRNEGLAPW